MKKTKGSIMLLFAAFFWGTTFVAQTTASDQIGTFTFNGSPPPRWVGGENMPSPPRLRNSWSGISCAVDSCSYGNEESESKGKWRTSRKRKYKTDRDRWYPLWLCIIFRNESAAEWYRGLSGRRGQLRQIGVSHRNVCGYGCNRIRATWKEITQDRLRGSFCLPWWYVHAVHVRRYRQSVFWRSARTSVCSLLHRTYLNGRSF